MTVSITDKLKEGIVLAVGEALIGPECAQKTGLPVMATFSFGGCHGSHIRQMAGGPGKMPSEERERAIDYERPQPATEACHHMRQ